MQSSTLARAGQWHSEPGGTLKKSRGLLRQPGGFEGFSVVGDGSQFGHLVPRKCEKPSHRLVELHTAGAAPEVDRSKRQKPILRRIPELVDEGVPSLELIIDLGHPAQQTVVAVIRGIGQPRMEHEVVVENLGVNLPLSGVPAVELPADQLLATSDHSTASIPPPMTSAPRGERQPALRLGGGERLDRELRGLGGALAYTHALGLERFLLCLGGAG
jgi:hypothetical protein